MAIFATFSHNAHTLVQDTRTPVGTVGRGETLIYTHIRAAGRGMGETSHPPHAYVAREAHTCTRKKK